MNIHPFALLEPYSKNIKVGLTDRHDGNVRFGLFEDDRMVIEHRNAICKQLKIDPKKLVSLNQTHSDNILLIMHPHDIQENKEYDNFDAMVTNVKGLFLMIQVADCQPVVMYDPVKEVVANVHNGWRGSTQKIVGKTIENMKTQLGCDPSNILVGIGPSLGPCHSEFTDPYKELPEFLHPYIGNNNHVDFWQATIDECLKHGIVANHIELLNYCTVDSLKTYYSHRGEKGKAGRFATIIGIK